MLRILFATASLLVAAQAETWTCSDCAHVYDPAADGNGKAFEDLPDTWTCPVCGVPKSHYSKSVVDGKVTWMHQHASTVSKAADDSSKTWTCADCGHVYDPAADGNGKAFEDLPDTWTCPVCGVPKSHYSKSVVDGKVTWTHQHASAVSKAAKDKSETWTCADCGHVYDPAADGNGKAFEDLPDTWTCPVCGVPKSHYSKSVVDGKVTWMHQHASTVSKAAEDKSEAWTCADCGHVYDPAVDGNGKAFEELPDTWTCPVCGVPKSHYSKSVVDGKVTWMHQHASTASKAAKGKSETWTCKDCGHVYDAAADGNGKAFEDLPDSWVCPTCGVPKSHYSKSVVDGLVVWSHEPAATIERTDSRPEALLV